MPLRYLFLDMNAYFASVEQQFRPELRHRPVAVIPMKAETTCCIAASYEAKNFGVKTGTVVREARKLCPQIRLVEARPELYVEVHHRMVEAVESCLPVQSVRSIDEVVCRLMGSECEPDRARQLAFKIKEVMRHKLGEYLKCSIGLGPNVILSKVAADLRKPDGLSEIESEELPQQLYSLSLSDLPGVGPRMERRLHGVGIHTMEQFCQLSEDQLSQIWGSKVWGGRWWNWLRGGDLPEPKTCRKSLGHSHVLAPQYRTRQKARQVIVRMLHKAASRLRQIGYWARTISVQIEFFDRPVWNAKTKIPLSQDTLTLLRTMLELWEQRPPQTAVKVGVVLGDLIHHTRIPQLLFDDDRRRNDLASTMDRINSRFGADSLYFGGMHGAAEQAPTRISFTHIPTFERKR
ncbi:MAG: DNA polymerase [Planctomycetota bacterium]|nr:DNA polymerase [Planctomycetota bacterium]MDA1211589.1 DNA polymerase [Planctomycetota bacterium]